MKKALIILLLTCVSCVSNDYQYKVYLTGEEALQAVRARNSLEGSQLMFLEHKWSHGETITEEIVVEDKDGNFMGEYYGRPNRKQFTPLILMNKTPVFKKYEGNCVSRAERIYEDLVIQGFQAEVVIGKILYRGKYCAHAWVKYRIPGRLEWINYENLGGEEE